MLLQHKQRVGERDRTVKAQERRDDHDGDGDGDDDDDDDDDVHGEGHFPILYIQTPDRPPQRLLC